MWKSVDWKTQFGMTSAPEALVEPIQRLVTLAREALRSPDHTDTLGRKYAYREFVSLRHVVFKMSLFTKPKALASQGYGLFIAQMEIGPIGVPIGPPDEIQTPQVREAITTSSIYSLRGIYPDAIEEAIEQLLHAVPITHHRWDQLVRLAPMDKTRI